MRRLPRRTFAQKTFAHETSAHTTFAQKEICPERLLPKKETIANNDMSSGNRMFTLAEIGNSKFRQNTVLLNTLPINKTLLMTVWCAIVGLHAMTIDSAAVSTACK
jgi:hypothetical protein